jgi:hypothetical protein
MCACTTKDCATKVDEEKTAWMTATAARLPKGKDSQLDDLIRLVPVEIWSAYGDCELAADPPPARSLSELHPTDVAACDAMQAAVAELAACDKVDKAVRAQLVKQAVEMTDLWKTRDPAVAAGTCESMTRGIEQTAEARECDGESR